MKLFDVSLIHPFAPHGLYHLLIRHHSAAVFRKQEQQIVFRLGEPNFGFACKNAAGIAIDRECADAESAVRFTCSVLSPGAESGTHSRKQFGRTERLCNIIICTAVKRNNLVRFVAACGKHYYGHGRTAADELKQLHSVPVGQPEVKKNKVGHV